MYVHKLVLTGLNIANVSLIVQFAFSASFSSTYKLQV